MEQSKFSQETENENVNINEHEASGASVTDNMAGGADNMTENEVGEADVWRDKYVRLSAEFDNYRKRTMREKMELITAGGEQVIRALLPVVDDFGRALEAIEKSSDIEQLRQGVVLISGKLNDTLRAQGVTEIDALGKELDTDLHEAVARFAAGDKHKGKVVDVAQKGYKLGEKVIRHSKVIVGE